MTTINVTEEHIAKGLRGACGSCPVALAIRGVVKPGTEVYVREDVVYLESEDLKYRRIKLPAPVREWIMTFDHRLGVSAPISFDLNILQDLLA